MSRRAPGLAVVLAGSLLASGIPAVAQDDVADTNGAERPLLELSRDGGPPEAGRYRDSSLGVDLEFTIPDGWADGWAAPVFGVFLESDFDGTLAIGRVDDFVYERPCEVEDDDAYESDHADFALTPESLIGHWEANPLLGDDGANPVSVAGIEGYQLDVRVDLSGLGRRCAEPEVPLWGNSEIGSFTLRDDERARIVTFEADGQNIVVVLGGLGREAFESALEIGMPVVESLSLGSAEASAE